jgi:hypothetical protein
MNQVALFTRSPDRQPGPEHSATIKAVAQAIESDNPTLQPRIRLCRFLLGLDRAGACDGRSKDTRCLSPSGADLNAWQLFASSSRNLSLRSRPVPAVTRMSGSAHRCPQADRQKATLLSRSRCPQRTAWINPMRKLVASGAKRPRGCWRATCLNETSCAMALVPARSARDRTFGSRKYIAWRARALSGPRG